MFRFMPGIQVRILYKHSNTFYTDNIIIPILGHFSPGVTYALEHNCLIEAQRREFVKDIYAQTYLQMVFMPSWHRHCQYYF